MTDEKIIEECLKYFVDEYEKALFESDVYGCVRRSVLIALQKRDEEIKESRLLCINCQKEVADVKGEINGITTWFAVCSECLYNVKGWKRGEIKSLSEGKSR